MVWAAAFLLGCLNALGIPAREAFTMELAGPENVTNAVALNNVVRNAARACGPALGGVLITSVGIGACFLLNTASYAVVGAALRRMHPADLYTEGAAPHRRGQIREGLRYVWKHPTLGTVLLIVAIATTFVHALQGSARTTQYTGNEADRAHGANPRRPAPAGARSRCSGISPT